MQDGGRVSTVHVCVQLKLDIHTDGVHDNFFLDQAGNLMEFTVEKNLLPVG